jgi:hypothetical protein
MNIRGQNLKKLSNQYYQPAWVLRESGTGASMHQTATEQLSLQFMFKSSLPQAPSMRPQSRAYPFFPAGKPSQMSPLLFSMLERIPLVPAGHWSRTCRFSIATLQLFNSPTIFWCRLAQAHQAEPTFKPRLVDTSDMDAGISLPSAVVVKVIGVTSCSMLVENLLVPPLLARDWVRLLAQVERLVWCA